MKKKIFSMLVTLLMLGSMAKAGEVESISPEADKLSKDAQFVEMINSIFNFSADIYLHKRQDALKRYAEHAASEGDIKDILEATGIKDEKELQGLFNKISANKKTVSEKYKFLTNDEKGQSFFNEGVLQVVKSGKLIRFINVDVDCLASAMSAFGSCYVMMEQCSLIGQNGGSNNEYNNCIAMVTACLALAFIASDQCFNLGILPF